MSFKTIKMHAALTLLLFLNGFKELETNAATEIFTQVVCFNMYFDTKQFYLLIFIYYSIVLVTYFYNLS